MSFTKSCWAIGCRPMRKSIGRQAFAGMLWSKQYYHFVVIDWLYGDPAEPAPPPVRTRWREITSGGTCSRAT